MSRMYEVDEAYRTTFLYAKDVLLKPYVIVTIGDDAWKDSELGCAIGPQEVCRNTVGPIQTPKLVFHPKINFIYLFLYIYFILIAIFFIYIYILLFIL